MPGSRHLKVAIFSPSELLLGTGILLLIYFQPSLLPAAPKAVLELKTKPYLCRALGHVESCVLEQPHHCHQYLLWAHGTLACASPSSSTKPGSMATLGTNTHNPSAFVSTSQAYCKQVSTLTEDGKCSDFCFPRKEGRKKMLHSKRVAEQRTEASCLQSS